MSSDSSLFSLNNSPQLIHLLAHLSLAEPYMQPETLSELDGPPFPTS